MQKRGQLLAHPFTAILTLVVAALIIFFGITVIRDLYNIQSQVDITSFRTNLQKEVNSYYTLDEGSQKLLSIPVPKEIIYICFVDQSTFIDYSKIPNNKDILVQTITDKNTFFISKQGAQTISPVQIDHLKPSVNPLCIITSGNLNAKIITKGNYVELSS